MHAPWQPFFAPLAGPRSSPHRHERVFQPCPVVSMVLAVAHQRGRLATGIIMRTARCFNGNVCRVARTGIVPWRKSPPQTHLTRAPPCTLTIDPLGARAASPHAMGRRAPSHDIDWTEGRKKGRGGPRMRRCTSGRQAIVSRSDLPRDLTSLLVPCSSSGSSPGCWILSDTAPLYPPDD